MIRVVLELTGEDGNDASLADDAFAVEQLGWMERDRESGGYLLLDGTNYAMSVKITGVLREVKAGPNPVPTLLFVDEI